MPMLKELREKRNWSQAELARRSELNASTLSMIERGMLKPYAVQTDKLVAALDLSKREADELRKELAHGGL